MDPKSTTKQKKAILAHISKHQLAALTEIAFNILRGNVNMTDHQKQKLKRHAHKARILGNPKLRQNIRKKALSVPLILHLLNVAKPFFESNFSDGEH
jgi:hypothetical protein